MNLVGIRRPAILLLSGEKAHAHGVPADHVTIVGASLGGGIALVASSRLQNPKLRFCVLGVCLSEVDHGIFADGGMHVAGRVLSIREQSDESTETCRPWKAEGEWQSRIVSRELMLDTGLGHGFLCRPLPEWLNPAVEWIEAR